MTYKIVINVESSYFIIFNICSGLLNSNLIVMKFAKIKHSRKHSCTGKRENKKPRIYLSCFLMLIHDDTQSTYELNSVFVLYTTFQNKNYIILRIHIYYHFYNCEIPNIFAFLPYQIITCILYSGKLFYSQNSKFYKYVGF